MKKFIKAIAMSAAAAASLLLVSLGVASYYTPDSFQVTEGTRLQWTSDVITAVSENGTEISADTLPKGENQGYSAKLMLYKFFPIKTVRVNVIKETTLIPCGTPFGIKMFTNGVVVIGVAEIQTKKGTANPAALAGLKVGDIIAKVNGKTVNTNREIADAVSKGNGAAMTLSVRRDKTNFTVKLQPVLSETDRTYKAGIWVRDSTAGIGTLTFYNPSAKAFAGLGHGVCDSDTNELMPLLTGDIVPVTISGVSKGEKGSPGELKGYFTSDEAMGRLQANVPSGVFGTMNSVPAGQAVKVGMKQEIKTGPAKIRTTVDGEGPKYYSIEIEKIDYRENVQSKNMVIHITDAALLNKTGGIVQGMSGSPILQNGKLVGAVTHVFVNDPTRGYGIFAENMLAVAQSMQSEKMKKAS